MKKYSYEYYLKNGQHSDRLALGMYFRIFKRYVARGSKVLEFGAGNGHLSKRLSTLFCSDAIEISSHAVNNIKIISPKTRIIRNENYLELNSYEGIISLHTFEHLKAPETTLRKLFDSLKKGGVLLAVMPDPEGYGHRIKGKKWFAYRDKTHVSLLKKNKWIKIFEKNNLIVFKTGSDWFWDPPYFPIIPVFFQKLLFYPGCLLMVLFGRIIYSEKFGEDIILLARKN